MDPALPALFRDRLLPLATLATPNRFELEHLTGRACPTLEDAMTAARALMSAGPSVVVFTSLDVPDGPEPAAARCLVVSEDGAWVVAAPRLPLDPALNGAGHLLAALILDHWLMDGRHQVALSAAVSGLFAVLSETLAAGGRELALLLALGRLADSPRIWSPIQLDAGGV